jgi:hypothetical protein
MGNNWNVLKEDAFWDVNKVWRIKDEVPTKLLVEA